MNLKTYLFDKATVKSDIKRFWWVPAIFMLLLALFVLPRAVYSIDTGVSIDINHMSDEGFFALMFGFFLPGMLFSYLHKGNAVSFVHGLPSKRTTIFISHIFSGLIMLYLPIIIGGAVIGAEGMYFEGHIHYALKYMYTCGVYTTLAFMITTFAMLISGNTVAGYLFSLGFIILPGFAVTFTEAILSTNVFGFLRFEKDIINFIYLTFIDEVCTWKSLWYIALIIILFFVCIWLYRIRRLENYDEIVAFNPLKIVFMYTVAICFGYFGYVIFYDITDINALFLAVLPLGFAALIAAYMLNKKSFTFKGVLKHMIIFTALIAAVKITIAYDLTGYERRVPDVSELASISPYDEDAESTYYQYYKVNKGEAVYANKGYLLIHPIDVSVKDEKTMSELISIHKNILERERSMFKAHDENDNWDSNIKLVYNLKDGKHITRFYRFKLSDYDDCIAPYYENEQYKLAHYPLMNGVKKNIRYVTYNSPVFADPLELADMDRDKLEEALKLDIASLTYDTFREERNSYNSGEYITINYTEDIDCEGRTYTYNNSLDFTLNREFKNTYALISDYMADHAGKYIDLDSFKGIYIAADPYYEDYETGEERYETEANIMNKGEMKAVFDALRTNSQYIDESIDNTEMREVYITFTRDGGSQYGQHKTHIFKPYNQIPPEIRKYLKETKPEKTVHAGTLG